MAERIVDINSGTGEFLERLAAKRELPMNSTKKTIFADSSNSPEGTTIASITPIGVQKSRENHPTEIYKSQNTPIAPIADVSDQK